VEAVEKLVEGEARGSFRVTFAKSGRAVDCPDDTFVLEAARLAGLRLPASCTKGLCGTCKSRLVSGTVDMKHAGGIRQREIDEGLVLLCCSKPLTDLVVER
jgi:ferredoxin